MGGLGITGGDVLTSHFNCGDCVHAYDSADNKLRCRIHPRGLECNQAMFDDCREFLRETGADGCESPRWCEKVGNGN